MTEAAPAHACSEGAVNPALRVFKVPPTDISINAYRVVTIQPTTTGINPMEYIIPALDDYVDLGCSYFPMELRLQKSTNANLGADEKLWVTNNLAHTIIKQIDLQLNGTLISPQSHTYHYKAYVENLLNFNQEDGKTVLAPQGWFNVVDFPQEWTATDTDSTDNGGAGHAHWVALSANRKAALAQPIAENANYVGVARYSLVFTPHLEVFHTGKVLVPGVEIKMKFHFNSPNLFLNGVALAGRLVEGDIRLLFHLCQLHLNETIYKTLSAQRHHGKQLASYPTVHSEIRTFSMQGNLTRLDIPNLFQNRIPNGLIGPIGQSSLQWRCDPRSLLLPEIWTAFHSTDCERRRISFRNPEVEFQQWFVR